MKKFLSFMVMGLVSVLPFTVSAASEILPECGEANSEGVRTCTVSYKIDQATPQDTVTVTLTEQGGADVTDVVGISGSEFMINSKNEENGVWTVVTNTLEAISGTHNLFTFTYTSSGQEDCKVVIGIGNDNKEVTETPVEDTDEPTDNKQTGSTLPYIALGAVALIAAGAYVVTKNKSKMFRI